MKQKLDWIKLVVFGKLHNNSHTTYKKTNLFKILREVTNEKKGFKKG